MKKHVVDFLRFLDDKEGRNLTLKQKLENPRYHRFFPITKADLDYKGDLNLGGTDISRLPDGLKVGGSLYLTNTFIRSLPDGLKVDGDLYLRGTPLAQEYYAAEIRAMIEGTGGYVIGDIFV